jgi:acyl-[acyl-carrier-protein]-phospholipid O-acyltransferase / long-chain-fatty-acid--[acyl-carrier-protein] ligase
MSAQYAPWIIAAPIRWLSRWLYRVKILHAGNLPEGGALLLANHISYVDVLVLQLACPRPIRFVGHANLVREHWFFRWVFRISGTIPVSPENALATTRQVTEALAQGEYVLLFPEGAISRTGQLMKLERGFEVMARRAGVPVVPVYHDGLWGSVFSFSGHKYIFKSPRLLPTPVTVAWGVPIPPAQATAAAVRAALLDLGAEAFAAHPRLARHLGREVVRALAKRPGKIELIDCTGARLPVTAARLLAAAAVLSRHLRCTVAGPRIGIVLPPGAGAAITNLAVLCAGKIPVNLNFTAGRAAVEASLRAAGIRTVVSAQTLRAKLPDFPWPEDTRDFTATLAAAGGKWAVVPWVIAAWLLPNQVLPLLLGLPREGGDTEAALLFTSGSSGEPKGVMLTHRNILGNCWQIASLGIFPDTAIMLGSLPVFHSFGFTVNLWYPLLRGCLVVTLPSPLDARRLIDAIREEGCTVWVGAPTFIRPVLKKAAPRDLRTLAVLVAGAERLPDDLAALAREKFHLEIMQGYGLSETSPVASVNQPDPPVRTDTGEAQRGQYPGSVGRLLPGMSARLLDPTTREPLSATATGLLALRGANIFSGYLHDPAKSAAALHDGWFVTGDLARFDVDGFLFIEGRLSRFSKLAGEMVPHGTVEQKLLEAFAPLGSGEGYPVFVTGVPDAQKGEALVLLTTDVEMTVESVREKLFASGVPNLWIPKIVRVVDTIPVLGTGKLDLRAAREMALQTVKTDRLT